MASIYKFYIKNYLENGVIHTGETLFQDYPLAAGQTPMLQPKIKSEIGKAGSFEFSITPSFSFYKKMLQLKTIIRIEYFNETIFRGRVLTIEKADMFGSKSVHCEGDFVFLMDSQQEGIPDDKRPKVTVQAYLESLISVHNTKMSNEPDKQFTLGEVPGHYTSATSTNQRIVHEAKEDFGDSSYETTMDRLEDLVDKCGGFFRTRYVNGVTYLDWLEGCYNPIVNSQKIEISKNLLSAKSVTEVDNIFTKVIPIGGSGSGGKSVTINDYWPTASSGHSKVDYILVPELATIPLYSDEELNKGYHTKQDYADAINRYGYIEKTVTFDNARNPQELFTFAKDWIKMNYCGGIANFDVTAVDMKIVDGSVDCLLTGDTVDIVVVDYDEETYTTLRLTIISSDKDIYNPESDSFNIGTPNGIINATYGNKAKNGGGGGGKPASSTPPDNLGGQPIVHTIDEAVNKAVSSFWYKVESKSTTNTGYDSATSAFIYTDEGLSRSEEEINALYDKYLSKNQRKEISTNPELKDPEKLNEYLMNIPAVASYVRTWRVVLQNNLVEAGLPREQARLITEDREGLVNLASYVDDDGNPVWEGMSEYLINSAIRARKILNGEPIENTSGDLMYPVTDTAGIPPLITGAEGDFGDLNVFINPDDPNGGINIKGLLDPDEPTTETNIRDVFSVNWSEAVFAEDVELTLPEVVRRVKDGVAFGIYDEENLTAGVIVSKINDGSVFIKGSQIQIGGVGLDTKIIDLDGQVVNISHSIDDINDELADQETQLQAQGRSITTITSDVTLIGNNLTQAQMDIATNGQSIIALNSDVVSVANELQAAKARIGTIESNYLSSEYVRTHNLNVYSIQSGAATFSGNVNATAGLTCGDILSTESLSVGGYYMYPTQILMGQPSASTSGNTVTLTFGTVAGTSFSVSFSKAGSVTLSGSWSGNKYTVTASTGQSISETLTPSPANASTINTFTNHMAYITVAATSVTQGPLFRWTVDATSEYNSGYNAGRASVKPQINASWSGGVLTISTNPTAQANVYEYLGKGTVTWSGVTGTVPITAAPSSGAQGTTVYTATVTAPFRNVQDDQQRNTFYAYYYNKNGSLESMGNHNWYYHT